MLKKEKKSVEKKKRLDLPRIRNQCRKCGHKKCLECPFVDDMYVMSKPSFCLMM